MSRTLIKIFRTDNGPCPYLEKGNWQNISFQTSKLPTEGYTSLLNQGFRRSGLTIYHPVCSSCKECIPIRIDTLNFTKKRGSAVHGEKTMISVLNILPPNLSRLILLFTVVISGSGINQMSLLRRTSILIF